MGISINLEGKVALVTGASGSLGARFVHVLAAAGAQVVLASPRTERVKELRAEIEAAGGNADIVDVDVDDFPSICAAIAHAETEAGAIDILVNNAAVSTVQRLVDVTEQETAGNIPGRRCRSSGSSISPRSRGCACWRRSASIA